MNGNERFGPHDVWRANQHRLRDLPPNSRVKLLSEDSLQGALAAGGEWRYQGFRVVANSSFEDGLIAKAFESKSPIEVGMLRWIDTSGRVAYTHKVLFLGNSTSMSPMAVAQELPAFASRRCKGCILEFTHVHPAFEMSFVDKGTVNIYPLSNEDLQTAQFLSRRSGAVVRMRATVPNGYTYEIDSNGSTLGFHGSSVNKPPKILDRLLDIDAKLKSLKSQVSTLKKRDFSAEVSRQTDYGGVLSFLRQGMPGMNDTNVLTWLAQLRALKESGKISDADSVAIYSNLKFVLENSGDRFRRKNQILDHVQGELEIDVE